MWLSGNCTHLMGGEITWECFGGGQYVITMKVYRDCTGPAVSTVGQSVRIWNHPTMSTIPINLITQTDISPACTQVAGGPGPLTCASPTAGSIEEYVFQSPMIFIGFVPPAQGWAFTFDSFSRNTAIDNLSTPGSYGITLRAIMYPYNAQSGNPCYDSSPQFLERLHPTICAGVPHVINHNAFDPDGDSLVFSFAEPLDRINPITPVFNPPVSPIAIPFVAGFSATSPTPSPAMGAGNVAASINSVNGDISFTSVTQGNYVIVMKVESYRCNVKIAEVYREMQVVISPCAPNSAPVVTPPFGGTSFSTTVTAGALVNFTITATDNGTQPNGVPQIITITPGGGEFGAGFTNAASGCNAPPCATLSSGGPFTGTGSVSVNFSWQTDCSHTSSLSCGATSLTHNFVFKVQDDACPVPAVHYYTVSITVLPPVTATAPKIHCANVAINGDVNLSWEPAQDPGGTFSHYEIYYGGLLVANIPFIGMTTFTHVGADAQMAPATYYILTRSGCSGSSIASSDTVTTMFLTVNNPGNGTAVLQWNALHTPIIPGNTPFYNIYLEYPLGTWSLIGTVPYGVNTFQDTISTCYDTLNYKIEVIDSIGCTSFSSIDGDYFQDMIEPYVPVITFATVDTATGLAQINWNVNGAADTQGYIILQNQGGNWVVIDTIYGIGNTSYINLLSNADGVPEEYGVAAFDSCWWGVPPGPNTTGMSGAHQTMYLQTALLVCDSSVQLNWNAYTGWTVTSYNVFASENGGPYVLVATLNGSTTTFIHPNLNRNSTYEYLIVANSVNASVYSLSNISAQFISQPATPLFGYLNVATVAAPGQVNVTYTPDIAASINGYQLQRSDDGGYTYITRASVGPLAGAYTFTDDAETDVQSYFYRVLAVDSCGQVSHVSNLGRTIHLHAIGKSPELVNVINWNKYSAWDGNVQEYRLYRSINGVYSSTPVAVVTSATTSYSDDMFDYIQTTGEYCYYVEAIETANPGFANAISVSNEDCALQDPLVYIPNAFTPEGNNPLFIPVISYFDFTQYSFRIFNRWGEVIFETSDHNVGWDGNKGSKKLKEDVYVYMVTFKTGEGKPVEIRGFVTLLRPPGN